MNSRYKVCFHSYMLLYYIFRLCSKFFHSMCDRETKKGNHLEYFETIRYNNLRVGILEVRKGHNIREIFTYNGKNYKLQRKHRTV